MERLSNRPRLFVCVTLMLLVIGMLAFAFSPASAWGTSGIAASQADDLSPESLAHKKADSFYTAIDQRDALAAQSVSAENVSLSLSTTDLRFTLYTGNTSAMDYITVVNDGSETVDNVRLVRVTENTAATTSGAQKTVRYRWNDSGDVNNPLGWLWADRDYPCSTTDISLAPGESFRIPLKLYVDANLENESFPAGAVIADQFEIRASGVTVPLTVAYTATQPPDNLAQLSVGTFRQAENDWGLDKFNEINISLPAGTTLETGFPFGIKNESGYDNAFLSPLFRITSVQIEQSPEQELEGIFSIWGPGREYIAGGDAGMYSTAAFNLGVDTTYLSRGAYTANIVIGISPANVVVNNGALSVNQATCTFSIPVTLNVTTDNSKLPAKVENLEATGGDGYVYLEWDAVGGNNDGYQVYRQDKGQTTPIAYINGANTTYYTDTSVTNGTTYTYYVAAGASSVMKHSERSDSATATPQAGAPSRLLAPYLWGTDAERGYVRLTWELHHPFDRGDGNVRTVNMYNEETEQWEYVTYGKKVSHFVIYMDGAPVATVSQGRVFEDSYRGYYFRDSEDDPEGYYESIPLYRWTYDLPLEDVGIYHTFAVAAVDDAGLEGYLSDTREDCSFAAEEGLYAYNPEASYTNYYDDEQWRTRISCQSSWPFWDEDVEGGGTPTWDVYRKEGATETLVESNLHSDYYGMSWIDPNAIVGHTYTYRMVPYYKKGTIYQIQGEDASVQFTVPTQNNAVYASRYYARYRLLSNGVEFTFDNSWATSAAKYEVWRSKNDAIEEKVHTESVDVDKEKTTPTQ